MLFFVQLDEDGAPHSEIIVTLDPSTPLSSQEDKFLGFLKFSEFDQISLFSIVIKSSTTSEEITLRWDQTLDSKQVKKRSKLLLRAPPSKTRAINVQPPSIITTHTIQPEISSSTTSVRFDGILRSRTTDDVDMDELMSEIISPKVPKQEISSERHQLLSTLNVKGIEEEDLLDESFDSQEEWTQGEGDSDDDLDILSALQSFDSKHSSEITSTADMRAAFDQAKRIANKQKGIYEQVPRIQIINGSKMLKSLRMGIPSDESFDDLDGFASNNIDPSMALISRIDVWTSSQGTPSVIQLTFVEGESTYQTPLPLHFTAIGNPIVLELDVERCEVVRSMNFFFADDISSETLLDRIEIVTSQEKSFEVGKTVTEENHKSVQMLGGVQKGFKVLSGLYGSYNNNGIGSIGCYTGQQVRESLFLQIIAEEQGENWNPVQARRWALIRSFSGFQKMSVSIPIPFQERSQCFACESLFGWTRWKFHCACCGELYCYNCIPYVVYLHPALPCASKFNRDLPQSICDHCYTAHEEAEHFHCTLT